MGPAFAEQTYADGIQSAKADYDAARNTLGIARYCLDRGFVGIESLRNAKVVVALADADGVDKRDGDEWEQRGRAGMLMRGEDGKSSDLRAHPVGEQKWCKQARIDLKTAAFHYLHAAQQDYRNVLAPESRESQAMARFNTSIEELEDGKVDSGSITFSSRIAEAYETLLGAETERLQALVEEPDVGLRSLFRASSVAVFYTGNPAYLDLMERSLVEFGKRGTTPAELNRQMYEAYARTRRFDAAHALATRGGLRDVSPIPSITHAPTLDMEKPAWFRLEANGDGLLLDNPVLDPEFQVIVTTGAFCNPSHRALQEIHQDKALAGLLARHALWVMPADAAIHSAVLRQLTTDYPEFRFGIAYGKRNWPMVDNWATPVFHVFKDGRLVDQVVGWPEGGRAEALREALSQAGVVSDL